jgi:hypothetical protein
LYRKVLRMLCWSIFSLFRLIGAQAANRRTIVARQGHPAFISCLKAGAFAASC